MAFKSFTLPDGLSVTVYKRAGARSLRLGLDANNNVKVTIPTWSPYQAGLAFVHTKRAWIDAQRQPTVTLRSGQAVGKAHHLLFTANREISAPTSRVRSGVITVSYPADMRISSEPVQAAAQKGCIRALRLQAESLLPQRTASLAQKFDFSFTSVSVKQLKRRWGSCDSHKNIVYNLYLMQLPWEHIDYVILHELTHTRVLHHGPDFWEAMERVLPNVKAIRKQMRAYQPVLQ
jgi:predicted metal-dependent hydrolase